MKYESELIKEIVDSRGHDKSSLHYQSECVETWIEEAKGAYPKLCDYETEWLYYISVLDDTGGSEKPDPKPDPEPDPEPEPEEPPIGQFPYVALTDVTKATVDNVVPYAYKTANLKGLTLVNIKGEETNEVPMAGYSKHDFLIPLVKKDTDYLIKYNTTLSGGVLAVGFLNDSTSWSNNIEKQPNIGIVRLNSSKSPNYFRIVAGQGQTVSINNLMIVEYQEGMENWDIPYFEGMQSVQMPVLTTMGKNLIGKINKKPIFTWAKSYEWENDVLKLTLNDGGYNAVRFPIKLPKGIYYLSATHNGLAIGFRATNDDASPLVNPITITEDEEVIVEFMGNDGTVKENVIVEFSNIQVEEGSNATTYEPLQSNILTVNEDIELKSFEDLRDELNLLTGEMTQRVEKIVLDGSEDGWTYNNKGSATAICYIEKYFTTPPTNAITNYFSLIENRPGVFWNAGQDYEMFCVNDASLAFRIEKTKLKTLDSNGIKEWLSQNNLIIQYELATPIIKTVELTVVNQDGENVSLKPIEGTMHLSTSSYTIPPLFSGEIPVEAITQNLASFIEEE